MTEIEIYALSTLSNIPVVAYWVLLFVLIIGIASILYSQRSRIVQRISLLILVEWVVFIYCSAVVFRESREANSINLLPLWSYFDYADNSYLKEMAAVNFLNVLMFVPAGFLLKLGFQNTTWKHVLMVGLILSATIEILQLLLCKGLCEIDDLIHNVLGCMFGYRLCYMILKRYFKYV